MRGVKIADTEVRNETVRIKEVELYQHVLLEVGAQIDRSTFLCYIFLQTSLTVSIDCFYSATKRIITFLT